MSDPTTARESTVRTHGVLRRMAPRARTEEHRTATPLELFFDLCFVVAVAQASGHLVHAVAVGHAGHGVIGYLAVFFASWWAWMNFSWFASAYDTDGVPYRLMTLVQIIGSVFSQPGYHAPSMTMMSG